jgi:hypothetical protein
MWEVLHGKPPYEEALDLLDVAIKIRLNYMTPPIDKVPSNFAELMRMCWKPKPSDRCSFSDICKFLSNTSHKTFAV